LQDGANRTATGSLAVIDNTVDAATGTIHLKATFENRDAMLWPGQFVNVALTLDTVQQRHRGSHRSGAGRAAGSGGIRGEAGQHGGDSPGDRLGARWATNRVIEKGLAPGETVVTDGQMALFPGAMVRVVEAAKLGSGPQ
jgi:membrane fusion protein, multidrug efflux system